MLETLLIVDDNLEFSRSLGENLQELGFRSRHAPSGSAALAQLAAGGIQLVLLDIVLAAEDGLDVLRSIRRGHPDVPVVMMTGFASIGTAVQAMKLGAVDYVPKPINPAVLPKLVESAVSRATSHAGEEAGSSPRIITRDTTMLALLGKAERLANTELPVLVCGENGTGKELIAAFVHAHSPRRARPMVKVNCSAFPESLLDNELFGHERGAYTGADSTFRGVFERADGSTLFLDEIADMQPGIQAKILRVLQNGELRRIGGTETVAVDVRLVAATNRDLSALIAAGKFREDLLYRINAATLEVPPLRARRDDIPLLIDHFLSGKHGAAGLPLRMSSDALNILLSHSWPGNVRELRNVESYAASLAAGEAIEVADLPPGLVPRALSRAGSPPGATSLDEVERLAIASTLQQFGNNKKRTAEALKISRNTLYTKLKKYGFETSE